MRASSLALLAACCAPGCDDWCFVGTPEQCGVLPSFDARATGPVESCAALVGGKNEGLCEDASECAALCCSCDRVDGGEIVFGVRTCVHAANGPHENQCSFSEEMCALDRPDECAAPLVVDSGVVDAGGACTEPETMCCCPLEGDDTPPEPVCTAAGWSCGFGYRFATYDACDPSLCYATLLPEDGGGDAG